MAKIPFSDFTDEQFIEIIQSSYSFRQVLMKLNKAPKGDNYRTVRKRIAMLSLDTSHFLGQGHNKGKVFGPKRDIDEYLTNSFPINSNRLRRRLLKEKVKEHRCEGCNLTEWQGNPIPLELDHIDGNSENNLLSNLRLLCPNCHALTPTYRGRNMNRRT